MVFIMKLNISGGQTKKKSLCLWVAIISRWVGVHYSGCQWYGLSILGEMEERRMMTLEVESWFSCNWVNKFPPWWWWWRLCCCCCGWEGHNDVKEGNRRRAKMGEQSSSSMRKGELGWLVVVLLSTWWVVKRQWKR